MFSKAIRLMEDKLIIESSSSDSNTKCIESNLRNGKRFHGHTTIERISNVDSSILVDNGSKGGYSMKFNKEINAAYGNRSALYIKALADNIGVGVSRNVGIAVSNGCQQVNGVDMPKVFVTTVSNLAHVNNCVKEFYNKWGGDAPDNVAEVCVGQLGVGVVPLYV